MSTSEKIQLIITILTAFTAIAAAFATWRGPISAAELADRLKQSSDRDTERRRHKLHVFATLMQERASIASLEGVRALNLIDVIFHDSREVREAWAELFLSYDSARKLPPHVQEERLRKLLLTMANDLGLGEQLRTDDFGRVYYPSALAEEDYVRNLERRASLQRLEGQTATANTAPPQPAAPWPPKPE
jgi:hypothetical protein